MKVKDLIKALQECDPELEVLIPGTVYETARQIYIDDVNDIQSVVPANTSSVHRVPVIKIGH